MPGVESSHGVVVVFDDVEIGKLISFDVESKSGQLIDSTNVNSTVVGSGFSSRVIRWYDCTSIEPPIVTVSFWGAPSYTPWDCGRKGFLVFETSSQQIEGEAMLVSWSYGGRQNQYTSGTAVFQLTGDILV